MRVFIDTGGLVINVVYRTIVDAVTPHTSCTLVYMARLMMMKKLEAGDGDCRPGSDQQTLLESAEARRVVAGGSHLEAEGGSTWLRRKTIHYG